MIFLMLFPIGFLIGVAMTAPVGGVNIMCLRKSLNFGFWSGFTCASGAIIADAIFAGIAIFGIGYISNAIKQHEGIIQLAGGLIVMMFGFLLLSQKDQPSLGKTERSSDPGGPLASFVLTITNPGTIFGFIAFFSALNRFVPPPSDVVSGLLLLLGVVTGCTLWWSAVAGFAAQYRHKLSSSLLRKINIYTAVALLAFGAAILVRLLVNASV